MIDLPNIINQMIKYQRGLTRLTFRDNFYLSWIEKNGRATESDGGNDLRRNIGVGVIGSRPYVRMAQQNYQSHTLEKQQNFSPRARIGDTALDIWDNVVNQGSTNIIDVGMERMGNVLDGIKEDIMRALFDDGSDAANLSLPEGLETVFPVDGSYAVTDTDLVAIPETTYAGQPTGPGLSSTVWTQDNPLNAAFGYDWPSGRGAFEFDFGSPKLLNANYNYGTPADEDIGWRNTGPRTLRRAIHFLNRTGGQSSRPNICVMGSEFLLELKDSLEERTREIVPHTPNTEMGFPGTINFEGALVRDDFYCNPRVAYLLNPKAVELYSMKRPADNKWFTANYYKSGMFFGVGPAPVDAGLRTVYYALFFGGTKYHPKHMAKIAEYSAGADT